MRGKHAAAWPTAVDALSLLSYLLSYAFPDFPHYDTFIKNEKDKSFLLNIVITPVQLPELGDMREDNDYE